MDLGDTVRTLRERWRLAVILVALGAVAGYLMAASTTPVYRAASTVFVSVEGGQTVGELVQGSTYTQNLVQSYVELATMPIVLDPVIERLGLDTSAATLAQSITAQSPLDTVLVEISMTGSDAEEAARVADAVAAQLAVAVTRLTSSEGANGTVSVRTIAPAEIPDAPIAPNTVLLVSVGALLCPAIGLGLALLRQRLDTRVRQVADVTRATDAAVLGTIGDHTARGRGAPVMIAEPHSITAESYRRLRTNLKFVDVAGPLRSIVVTSPMPADGKSTTALNLALALAEGESSVLLVDADLRRPSVAEYCGLEGSVGLTTVLIGDAELDDVVQPFGDRDLTILPAGAVPPNPTQLVGSPAMSDLLARMVTSYDVVIIDTPPLLPVADSTILARLADGAVIVAAARRTRREQLREAIGNLEAVGAVCFGVVLGRVVQRDSDAYYGYAPKVATGRRAVWRASG